MTDNPAPYRSNKSVPDRVDSAWQRGYEAGQEHWKRVAVLAFLAGWFAVASDRRSHPLVRLFTLYALVMIAVAAVFVLPMVGLFFATRGIVRHLQERQPPPLAPVYVLHEGDDPF